MSERVLKTTRHARYHALGDVERAHDIWVAIHGYGQLARDFAESCHALAGPGRAVLVPEALNRYYKDAGTSGSHAHTPVGATWMTREFREQEIADYVEYLDALVRAERRPGQRLCALGFSQGVATLTRWITLGASAVDRAVAWAGRLPDDLDLPRFASRLPNRSLDCVVGTRDEFASWVRDEASTAELTAANITVTQWQFDGGHRLDTATLNRIASNAPPTATS